MSVWLSFCLASWLSICLSVCLSIGLSVCLSVWVYIYSHMTQPVFHILKQNRNSSTGGDFMKEFMWTFDVDSITQNN